MSTETLSAPTSTHEAVITYMPEAASPDVKSALNPDSVSDFFESQMYAVHDGRRMFVESAGDVDAGELALGLAETTEEVMRSEVEAYLDASGIDEEHPVRSAAISILEKYAYGDDFKKQLAWMAGDASASDERLKKPGIENFKLDVDTLTGGLSPEAATGNFEDLNANLGIARAALAELSVKRRRLMTAGGSKKARALAAEYEAAQNAYDQAKREIGQFSIESMQAAGMADDEIMTKVREGVLLETVAVTEAEREFIETEGGKVAKFMRWYAGKKSRMIGTNVIAGVAAGAVIGKFAKYGFIAAVPGIGIGVVAGARVGKSLLMAGMAGRARLNTDFEKRQRADWTKLESVIDEKLAGASADNLNDIYVNTSSAAANERIEEDVKANRRRAVISGAVAGVAVLGGAIAAHHFIGGGGRPETGGAARDAVPSPKTPDDILREAGVTDPAMRQNIIDHPDQFRNLVTGTRENFDQMVSTSRHIRETTGLSGADLDQRVRDTLAFAHHLENAPKPSGAIDLHVDFGDTLAHGSNTFTVPRGGGIIHDIIRPAALSDGHSLSSAQESQVWNAVRLRFGDNLFTDNVAITHGADQWIANPGSATLKPEVAQYLHEQIALAKR